MAGLNLHTVYVLLEMTFNIQVNLFGEVKIKPPLSGYLDTMRSNISQKCNSSHRDRRGLQTPQLFDSSININGKQLGSQWFYIILTHFSWTGKLSLKSSIQWLSFHHQLTCIAESLYRVCIFRIEKQTFSTIVPVDIPTDLVSYT